MYSPSLYAISKSAKRGAIFGGFAGGCTYMGFRTALLLFPFMADMTTELRNLLKFTFICAIGGAATAGTATATRIGCVHMYRSLSRAFRATKEAAPRPTTPLLLPSPTTPPLLPRPSIFKKL